MRMLVRSVLACALLLVARPVLAREPQGWREIAERLNGSTQWERATEDIFGQPHLSVRARLDFEPYAPREALLQYVREGSAPLRYSAFCALTRFWSEQVDLADLIAEQWEDPTPLIVYGPGSIQAECRLVREMLHVADPVLTEDQKGRLLDRVLASLPERADVADLVSRWTLQERHIPRVLELARLGHGAALVALAKLRRPQDLGELLHHLNSSETPCFEVAVQFPHPAFLAVLVERSARDVPLEGRAGLCRAVASFRDWTAASWLGRQLDQTETGDTGWSFSIDEIANAVGGYPCAPYTELLLRLWGEHGRVTAAGVAFLYEVEPARTLELCRATLGRDSYVGYECLARMLEVVIERAPDEADVQLRKRATAGCGWGRPVLLSIAAQRGIEEFIEPSFAVLEDDRNPARVDEIGAALLSYQRPDIEARLREYVARMEAEGREWVVSRLVERLAGRGGEGGASRVGVVGRW